MKLTSSLIVAVAMIVPLFFLPAHAQSAKSESELQLGVDAYKNSHYDDAVHHFEKAVDLDDSNLTARLYLANTCTNQYIPGVDSPENVHWAEEAIQQYQRIIDSDGERASKINSAKGIAYLHLNMKKFDDSRRYYEIASDLDRNDPEPYYFLGVIDWTKCYQARMEARARLALRPEQQLNASDKDQKRPATI